MKHCPSCGTEYEDFARECMDCHVSLVAGPMKKAGRNGSGSELVAIRTFLGFTAAAESEMCKNLLEAHEIPCMVTGANSARLSNVALDVRLLVREEDAQHAIEILNSDAVEELREDEEP